MSQVSLAIVTPCAVRRSAGRKPLRTPRTTGRGAGERAGAMPCTARREQSSDEEGVPVANIKSQLKRIRTNEQNRRRNQSVKSHVKTAIRKFREAAAAGEKDRAIELQRAAGSTLDRAVSKGVLHKNQAANKKSSMARQLNKI